MKTLEINKIYNSDLVYEFFYIMFYKCIKNEKLFRMFLKWLTFKIHCWILRKPFTDRRESKCFRTDVHTNIVNYFDSGNTPPL